MVADHALPAMPDELVTTYLHMTPHAFRPAYLPPRADVTLGSLAVADVDYYRFLYAAVGGPWRWRDRLAWDDATLHAHLSDPRTEVHVLSVSHAPVGYFELVHAGDGRTELAYFGLRPAYIGRGLGKHLLSVAVARAFAAGAHTVWLHTCNLDAPQALANYLARGFAVSHVERAPMPGAYA